MTSTFPSDGATRSADQVTKVPQTPARPRVRTSRKILFATISFMIALLVCEAAVRVRGWAKYGHDVDGMIQHDATLDLNIPTPGYRRSGGRVGISINSSGFRGEEFSVEKPAGVIRVVCLGASTTFCGEVSDNNKTWPHRLQELLREQYGPDIEVINAGVPGYTTDESLKNLTKRVLPLQPDIMIVYHANNDMAKDTGRVAVEAGIVETRNSRPSGAIAFLSRYSMLVDLIYKNFRIQSGGNDQKLEAIPPDLPDRFVEQFSKIHEIAKQHDIQLVLSTFLTKYRRDQDRATQTKNADVAFYYMPWMDIEGLSDAMDLYNSAIVDFADLHGIPVVREYNSIPADDNHYVDCMHMTDAGCERMAQRFADFFVERKIIEQITARP